MAGPAPAAFPTRPADVPDPMALARIVAHLDQHAGRLADARYGLHAQGEPQTDREVAGHALAVLALSHVLAERALRTRWCDVADALAHGATLDEVAGAMALDRSEVRAGLRSWADGQQGLNAHYGSGGLTPAEADEVRALVAEDTR